MADSVDLHLGGTVLTGQRVTVSRAERTQGFPTDGAIGGSLFLHYLVEVDYVDKRLRLHEADA